MKPTLFFIVMTFVLCYNARAQTPPLPPPAPTAVPTADPNTVRHDLYDLALLHALQQIDFSETQIKIIRDAVKEAFDADKPRHLKDNADLSAFATEVRKARINALSGEAIPTELETKNTEIQKTIFTRMVTARRDAVEKILTVLYPTLSVFQKEQMDQQSVAFFGARRVPAQYRAAPAKAPVDEIQRLAAGAFVENVLLDDRMPALLETLKPLKKGDTRPAGDARPAAKP